MTKHCTNCGSIWTNFVTKVFIDGYPAKKFTCLNCGNSATQRIRIRAKKPVTASGILSRITWRQWAMLATARDILTKEEHEYILDHLHLLYGKSKSEGLILKAKQLIQQLDK